MMRVGVCWSLYKISRSFNRGHWLSDSSDNVTRQVLMPMYRCQKIYGVSIVYQLMGVSEIWQVW